MRSAAACTISSGCWSVGRTSRSASAHTASQNAAGSGSCGAAPFPLPGFSLRNASSEAELELWIETLRAQGDGLEARRAMKRFVEAYPEARRAAIYRRILSNAQ